MGVLVNFVIYCFCQRDGGTEKEEVLLVRKLSLILLLLVVICSLAVAERYALLVGINDYQNDIGALKYCVADVEAFRDALVQMASYKPENVHLMTDQMSGRDLPQFNNVLLRLENLVAQVQPED